jgi:hypothetical protein
MDNKKVRRAMNLRKMDIAVRHANDKAIARWLTYGIPDVNDSNDLLELAEDEDTYDQITRLFVDIMGDFS